MPTRTEALQELEWRRCRGTSERDYEACVYFLSHFCFIQHPEKGAIKIPLRPAQLEILEVWMRERYSLVLKARQIGWSTLVALYSLWLSFFWSDRQIVMLSKGEREAADLLKKSDYAFKRLPEWMRRRGPRRLDRNVKSISFANASQIRSLPSKEDPARGTAVSLCILDEWAFYENPEDAWASVEPIADVGGRIIALSTAKGWGTFFHTMWVQANQGIGKFKPMFYPWWANSDRDDAWYEAEKESKAATPWILHQEYPNDPEEAFIKSGATVYDPDMVRGLPIRDPIKVGSLSIIEAGLRAPTFVPQPNGVLRVWALPDRDDTYAIGADVAEGLEHGDYSTAHVLSLKRNRVAAVWHGHIDPDLFGEELAKLGWYYNAAFIGCEVNNHGLTTNKALQRLEYPHIYVRRELDGKTRHKAQQTKIGWLTTKASKPLAIDDLGTLLRDGLELNDQYTQHELLTFVRDERGSMGGSPYDDRVMSLAIAVQMLSHARLKAAEDSSGVGYFTWDYFFEKALGADGPERTPLGYHNVRGRVA